jgi:N-acetylmuramoyl-L-alanine amidase
MTQQPDQGWRMKGPWMSKRRAAGIGLLLFLLSIQTLPVATAGGKGEADVQEAVTLTASRARLRFGGATTLSGVVDPVTVGQIVAIVDEAGVVVAEATTDEAGAYQVEFEPRNNLIVHAQWLTAVSAPVTLEVKPLVKIKLKDVQLFGRARIKGNVRPAMPGQSIQVKLVRWGQTQGSKKVTLRSGRYFKTRMYVRRPGEHRARAILESPAHLRGFAHTRARGTALPSLSAGARADSVKRLESRLIDLGYYLPGSDAYFDYRTYDALLAFNKVQGRARVGSVDASTWRRLANPVVPKPRYKGPSYHVEIDQTRQVILVVSNKKVRYILHTSTGAGGATRDGAFTVNRKLAGTSGGGLYFPSYFDGLRAIHGWPEVPVYPASHGCSRVPMWAAVWIHYKVPLGTRVYVYH